MCRVQSLGWGLRFGHRACYRLYILDNSGSFDIMFHSHPEVVKAGWSIRSITQAQICTIEAPSPLSMPDYHNHKCRSKRGKPLHRFASTRKPS